VRGGSWGSFGRYVRSAYRSGYTPDSRYGNRGFRLALGHSGLGQGSGTTGQVATAEGPGRRVAEQRQTGASAVAVDEPSPDWVKRLTTFFKKGDKKKP